MLLFHHMVMQHPLVDGYIKVYILRRSRYKLNAKKMLAHDVTSRTMACKISAVLLLFTLYSLHMVNIVAFWCVFFPSAEKWHFFCKKSIFSHSFWPRRLKQTSFYRKLKALYLIRHILTMCPIESPIPIPDSGPTAGWDWILSICIFSFVMAYNNKKAGTICRCHITFCVQNQYLWFS